MSSAKKPVGFPYRLFALDRRLPPVAHWEPLAGHPAPHHLEETTMTSTSIAPSSHYYSAAPSSDLPRAGTPLVKTEGD